VHAPVGKQDQTPEVQKENSLHQDPHRDPSLTIAMTPKGIWKSPMQNHACDVMGMKKKSSKICIEINH
jgi:hypothetical protein